MSAHSSEGSISVRATCVRWSQARNSVDVSIPLGHLHHTVGTGSRLRVDVTSSNFPRRARNTNSGNLAQARDTERDIRIARNTIHHGDGIGCFLEMTVLQN